MSIIIVDDNATNQMIISHILSNEGYSNIRKASSAKELYRFLHLDTGCQAEEAVDLILMDMMMPEIDGLQACRRVLEDKRYSDVPIIFVSAVGESSKLAEALDAGATDYVMKPINKLELLARIRSALRFKREKDWHKEQDRRIRYELELARQVQRNVLSQPLEDERIKIAAAYEPSYELAGDYYAWFRIDKHRYGAILLDMMGHGISSSLVCMYISSVLKDLMLRITDPEEVMQELNRFMGRLYQEHELINYYFTAIFVLVNTENQTVEYVNAGHPSGLLVEGDKIELLAPSGPAIGLFDQMTIQKKIIPYTGATSIVLYTDGLLDSIVEGSEGQQQATILSAMHGTIGVGQHIASLGEPTDPSDAVKKLMASSTASSQRDDICLVSLFIKPPIL